MYLFITINEDITAPCLSREVRISSLAIYQDNDRRKAVPLSGPADYEAVQRCP